jgi:hypothetical protein
MMSEKFNLEGYTALRKKAEQENAKMEQAKGALDLHFKTLQEEFEVETLKDAEKFYNKLESEYEVLVGLCNSKIKELEEKWQSH